MGIRSDAAMKGGFAAWFVLAAFVAAPAHAAGSQWTGTLTGTSTKVTTRDSGGIVTTSRVVYRAVATFELKITASGTAHGTGTGKYLQATWHLEGTNGSSGDFTCDPHLAAHAFHVSVGGISGRLKFSFPDATESNKTFDCGAGYAAYGGTTHDLAESLARAIGKGVKRSGILTSHTDTTTGIFHKVISDRWVVKLKRA